MFSVFDGSLERTKNWPNRNVQDANRVGWDIFSITSTVGQTYSVTKREKKSLRKKRCFVPTKLA